jgi:hypothetical protein
VRRILCSDQRQASGLHEIAEYWSVEDIFDANVVLDAIEAAQAAMRDEHGT